MIAKNNFFQKSEKNYAHRPLYKVHGHLFSCDIRYLGNQTVFAEYLLNLFKGCCHLFVGVCSHQAKSN